MPDQKNYSPLNSTNYSISAPNTIYSNAVTISVGPHDFRMRFFDISHEHSGLIDNIQQLHSEYPAKVEIIMPLHFMAEMADILLQHVSSVSESGLLQAYIEQMQEIQKIGTQKLSLSSFLQHPQDNEE